MSSKRRQAVKGLIEAARVSQDMLRMASHSAMEAQLSGIATELSVIVGRIHAIEVIYQQALDLMKDTPLPEAGR